MQKYTCRVTLLENKKDSKGFCPIAIILTINRQRAYFTTPYKVYVNQWEGKVTKHQDAQKINAHIQSEISNINRFLIDKGLQGKQVTAAQVKVALTKGVSQSFYDYVEDLKKDKNKTEHVIYDKEMARLKLFAPSLAFNDIDTIFLRKFETAERKRGMANNTINSTFKWFRRVVEYARKDKLIDSNPFDDYTIPPYIPSERIFLEKSEREAVTKFWREKKINGSHYISLTYFLLGVYSGLRYSDWNQANDRVVGDVLRLRPLKTKSKWVILPIGPTLREIIDVVATLPPPFSADKTRDHLKVIAGRLEMEKNITTHVARHSFAAMCAQNKLPKSVTAELMGISVQTVNIYYHLTGENIREQAAALSLI